MSNPQIGSLDAVCLDNTENRVTIEYIADRPAQAGFDAHCLLVEDIGLREDGLVGLADEPIRLLVQLYPWEWMMHDRWEARLRSGRSQSLNPLGRRCFRLKLFWSNFGAYSRGTRRTSCP